MSVLHTSGSLEITVPHVLVVDDDPEVRTYLTSTLTSLGFAVVAVADGLAALREIERCKPDVVLADVRMPGMDGMLLLDAARTGNDLCDVPIVLMSGYADEALRVEAFERGAADFVLKPVAAGDLAARLRVRARDAARLARLERDSLVDALTGVANRRAVQRALDTELRRARRNRRSLAILVIDINDFKDINDTHGHLAGDEVLRQVARRLRMTLRATDVVGRIGGDEFLVVLPEQDERGAQLAADRVRFAAAEVRVGGAPIRLSIGIAWTPDGEIDADDLYRAADATMYRDKRAARALRAARIA
ncbi:MAG: diguanylate cyclase [Deltaproteobacteria bacterium]|nr:MAG: diguanylate cyclase [Deltaproteobacteria bacterium]